MIDDDDDSEGEEVSSMRKSGEDGRENDEN